MFLQVHLLPPTWWLTPIGLPRTSDADQTEAFKYPPASLTSHSHSWSPSNTMLLLLLLPTLLSSSPLLPSCTHHQDCTSTANPLVGLLERVDSLATCLNHCRRSSECRLVTFNLLAGSPYQGACFLLASCEVARPGGGAWVSSSPSCLLPRPRRVSQDTFLFPFPRIGWTWKICLPSPCFPQELRSID